VDEGLDATTAPLAFAAGADVLMGSAIFNDSENVTDAMELMRRATQV